MTFTVSTFDNRKGPTQGDPATGYYTPDRTGYVVRNDKTGEIFSVCDRHDVDWAPFWNIKDVKWKK
jgi:Colicin E5 ribonuclease domain